MMTGNRLKILGYRVAGRLKVTGKHPLFSFIRDPNLSRTQYVAGRMKREFNTTNMNGIPISNRIDLGLRQTILNDGFCGMRA
jgi:hypothetical protein